MEKKSLNSLSLVTALVFAFSFFAFPVFSFASNTNGTIDNTSRYVSSENLGWIDFGTSEGVVTVTDSALSGYAWSETTGWISLNCSNTSSCATVDYKVANNGEGTLSGYAYGENIGWIQFAPTGGGVTIDSSGDFAGYAWSENTGWIVFNCSTTSSCGTVSYKVNTDWRPASARSSGNPTTSSGSRRREYASTPALAEVTVLPTTLVSNIISSLVPSFLKPKPKPEPPKELPPEETLSKTTPPIFSNKLNLISTLAVGRFVLAPLPSEIIALTKKFPELGKTFAKLGITKISDLDKLQNAKFVLSGISSKQSFPSEIVFAKTGDLIDYNIHLGLTDDGNPEQRINTIAGRTLDLIVKVDKPAKNVKGYLVVKNIERQVGKINVPATSFMAGAIMATLGQTLGANQEVQIEKKMVLNQFEYNDENNDGIYTAEIQAPLVHGEYEIISIIEYVNTAYGKKELRLTAVVDPEGYIFEKNGNKETRIPDAKVSLLWKNPKNGKFELWPAKDFQQVNPQKTDKSGTYSFLVPEGTYKLTVSAPGYNDFMGQEFDVNEGRGVHDNISLQSRSWFKRLFGGLF